MNSLAILELQMEICRRYGADHFEAPNKSIVGVSKVLKSGLQPINGLRHQPEGDASGWYLFAGEDIGNAPDFFQPLHVGHLDEWCPAAKKYLGLPPGWRFLIADGYEDVWYDPSFLRTKIQYIGQQYAVDPVHQHLYRQRRARTRRLPQAAPR